MKRTMWPIGFILIGLLTGACGIYSILEKKAGAIDGIPDIEFMGMPAQLYGALLIVLGFALTFIGTAFYKHLHNSNAKKVSGPSRGSSND